MRKRTDKTMAKFAPHYRQLRVDEANATTDEEQWACGITRRVLDSRFQQGFPPTVEDEEALRKIAMIMRVR